MLSSVWSAEQKRLEMRAKLHHCRSSRLQWRSQTRKSRSILRCVQNCVSVGSSRLQWLVWHRLGCTDGHRQQKQSLTCTFMSYHGKKLVCRWSVTHLRFIEYIAKSLKVIQNGTIRKLGYGFLFAFRSNYGSICVISEILRDTGWKSRFFPTSLHS